MADDVTILIDGQEVGVWSKVELRLQMDSYSTVEFSAPFDAANATFRELFRPFSFKPIEIAVDGELAMTGTVVPIEPDSDGERSVVVVGGYAFPGVLQDCETPASALPTEFHNMGLRAIAEQVVRPWGFEVDFRAPEGAPFKTAKLDVDKGVHDFLVGLARQRNLIVGSTPAGGVLCWRSAKTGRPVARLVEGEPPCRRVAGSFSPQQYFSELTGYVPGRSGKPRGSRYTLQNPWLNGILRPHGFTLDDTEPGDAPAAVRAKMGRMFANMASYRVDVAGWRDASGALWAPNTTVAVLAPNSMVYTETELLIRAVNLNQDSTVTSAQLECVLPGAFEGEIPGELPWLG